VLIVVALVWWLLRSDAGSRPDGRPSLQTGESYGIDVSSHQGLVDWRRVVRDDIAFTYIKASEGGDFTDARFAANWTGAAEASVRRGAYHFFTLCRPGREQAEHFLKVVAPDAAALPPAVDLELIGNCTARPSPAVVAAELGSFLAAVESAWGRAVVLYVGDEWEARYPVLGQSARPHWVKATERPAPPWAVWQLRALADVDGVRGPVDLDVGRLADLR
jgi:lysozyme